MFDVRHEAVRGGEARVPVREAFFERERKIVGGELAVGVNPEVVIGSGFVGGVGLRGPVDRGKDDERMRSAFSATSAFLPRKYRRFSG